jgi:hypothetical protein
MYIYIYIDIYRYIAKDPIEVRLCAIETACNVLCTARECTRVVQVVVLTATWQTTQCHGPNDHNLEVPCYENLKYQICY